MLGVRLSFRAVHSSLKAIGNIGHGKATAQAESILNLPTNPVSPSAGHMLQAPHFLRSLEWLLFTALDASSGGHAPPSRLAARPVTNTALSSSQDASQAHKAGGPEPANSRPQASAGPLLQAAADLVRHFPEVGSGPCLKALTQQLRPAFQRQAIHSWHPAPPG